MSSEGKKEEGEEEGSKVGKFSDGEQKKVKHGDE